MQVLQSLKLTGADLAVVVEIAVVGAGRHAGEIELHSEMQGTILRQIFQAVDDVQGIGRRGQEDHLLNSDRRPSRLPRSAQGRLNSRKLREFGSL